MIPGSHNTWFRNTPDWLCSLPQCLVTCGKGHKHRQVWCQFGEDRLSDRLCDPETKPASMQTCQQPECASWQAGPWGQVFWTIKFLTTFFPSYLKRACRGAFQGWGFNCWALGLAPYHRHTGRNTRNCSRFAQGLRDCCSLLEPIVPFADPRAGPRPGVKTVDRAQECWSKLTTDLVSGWYYLLMCCCGSSQNGVQSLQSGPGFGRTFGLTSHI